MQNWLVLGAAIACEVLGTICMRLSESLVRWRWIPPMLALYLLALGGLAIALKTIEVGVAYAVWAGLGTVLIAIIGVRYFNESVTPLKLASMALVIIGVIGLHMADARGH